MTALQAWTMVAVVFSAVLFVWLEARFPYNAGYGLLREAVWPLWALQAP